MADSVSIATSVLGHDGEPFSTLSLAPGMPAVTESTPVAEARRNYMRLAALIHPDKVKNSFDKATEAFQCLVRAFECFADPKARKAAARKANVGEKTRKRTKKEEKQSNNKKTKAKTKKTPKPKKRNLSASESESETEDDSDSASDDENSDVDLPLKTPPPVSTSRTPIGKPRVGEMYTQTTIGCPNCRSAWEPDSKPQYSLFMGPWGRKVHCQLCLLLFGSATAIHSCPKCFKTVEYDSSMYEDVTNCSHCKRKFGFPYYPVNQMLIDQIALDEWKDNEERQKAKERAARASRRGNAGDDSEMVMLVGRCITEERCPLCNTFVRSKQRAHVEECLKKSPAERKGTKAAGTKRARTTTRKK